MDRNYITFILEVLSDQINFSGLDLFNDKYNLLFNYQLNIDNSDENYLSNLDNIITKLIQKITNDSKIEIKNIVLVLSKEKITYQKKIISQEVSHKDQLIKKSDILEAKKRAIKLNIVKNFEILDLIPTYFSTETDSNLDFYPIGYKTNNFSMNYNLLLVEKEYFTTIINCLNKLNVKISNIFIDTICVNEFLNKEDLEKYAILELNKSEIFFSVFIKNRLFEILSISGGIDELIYKISSEYNINYTSSKNLLITNAKARMDLADANCVYRFKNNDKTIYIKENEITRIVEEYLNRKLNILHNEIKESKLVKFNEIYIGGIGSLIKNIDAKIDQVFQIESKIIKNKELGYDPIFGNKTLGAAKLNYKILKENEENLIKETIAKKETTTEKTEIYNVFEE